jgi:hypothetical protein
MNDDFRKDLEALYEFLQNDYEGQLPVAVRLVLKDIANRKYRRSIGDPLVEDIEPTKLSHLWKLWTENA